MNMYKKINIIIFVCMNGIFAMEIENACKQALQRNIISILAVNNYVMPVSSAYRALKKEAELPYECLEKTRLRSIATIKEKNKRIRALQREKYTRVREIPFIQDRRDVLHGNGYPIVRGIEVMYVNQGTEIRAYITTVRIMYHAEDIQFGSQKYYRRKEKMILSNDILKKLPQQLSTVFLLCSGDEYIDDRIVIKNMCNLTQICPIEKALVVWQPEDKILSRKITELKLLHNKTKELSMLQLSDDKEDIVCKPAACRRIMAILGALLFLYLYV